MTWREWWALECLAGFGIGACVYTLSWAQIIPLGLLVCAFAVFYHKRVIGQRRGR